MYSNPTYDPSRLALHNQQDVRGFWQQLNADPNRPLLAATYQQRYFPGSTFKVITASAVYDHQPDLASKSYPTLSALPLPQTNGQVLRNFGGEVCGGMLPDLFRISCNSGFAAIGLDLGGPNLAAEANSFGFNQTPPLDLPGTARAFFPAGDSFKQDLPGLAKSAIGQQSVQATPLEMALVASAIANHGVEMVPHLVLQVRDPSGRVVERVAPQEYGQPISPQTAAEMTQMMVSVVQSGTGTAAQIPGVTVAGKTGTAQHPGGNPHAWFVCFAPAAQPKLVVAVVVLDGGSLGSEATGGAVAAPIARAVLEAGLGR
jgi:peptidoglycan glycosyltransferase